MVTAWLLTGHFAHLASNVILGSLVQTLARVTFAIAPIPVDVPKPLRLPLQLSLLVNVAIHRCPCSCNIPLLTALHSIVWLLLPITMEVLGTYFVVHVILILTVAFETACPRLLAPAAHTTKLQVLIGGIGVHPVL